MLTSPFCYSNKIEFKNRLVMAPMAGITNYSFRRIVMESGAGLLYSEMISADGLVRNNKKTLDMLPVFQSEAPIIVQIFGSDPEILTEAARICQNNNIKMLDINMGCPVKKVFKTGAGVALMMDLQKCRAIVKKVRNVLKIPFSIKIRSGFENFKDDLFKIVKIIEEEGADLIAVHPRTKNQMFKGKADWSVIKKIKREVKIPVIGSGDIKCFKDAKRMREETGCDMVMIGRAASKKTWIFKEILTERALELEEKYTIMQRHLKYIIEEFGEEKGKKKFMKHMHWYLKEVKKCLR